METLNLGFNEIGPNGAYAIVSAMYNKDQLQSLNLNGNQFGEECREGIREMLEEQNRLHALEALDEDDSDAEDEDDDDDEVGVSSSRYKANHSYIFIFHRVLFIFRMGTTTRMMKMMMLKPMKLMNLKIIKTSINR